KMKKFLAILVVLALAVPAMAQDNITISFDNTTAGQLTISWDATGATNGGPVGFALAVVCSAGQIDDVEFPVDSFFDVYIDLAYDMETATPGSYTYGAGTAADAVADPAGPGVIALPATDFVLSFAGLGGTSAPPTDPPLTGSITITSDAGATVDVDVDTLRGGVVNKGGVMNVIGLPTTGIVIPPKGCGCPGDVYPWGGRDNYVTFDDLGELAYRLEISGWFIMPGDPNWDDCGDVYPPGAIDGYITFDDLGQLAYDLEVAGWFIDCSTL
ncbi:MAG: hypothetical protein JW709_06215, partial [Sedimentisphaerales bacterium]|nr:hypothetical protein [Sedimentisphaerales bacterium]